jgi:hypothetical protein
MILFVGTKNIHTNMDYMYDIDYVHRYIGLNKGFFRSNITRTYDSTFSVQLQYT